MADIIPGRQAINVGVQNQATGSDDLYTAFTKVETNFENLFTNASPYLNINGSSGILVTNPSSNSVTITNTGVTKLNPGTGITLDNSNGNVTISVSGSLTGVVAGVTNVGIRSTTLNVSGSPIISRGNIAIELPAIAISDGFNPGTYVSPTLTVDQYGRIVGISSISTSGTVTSVAITAGDGISITGSPIIDSGTISIVNTGITKLTAGPGISLSGNTGAVTISGINPTVGTVTRIDVSSQSLTVTGSPITSSGTISIELPTTATFNKITSANVVSTGPISAVGNISTTGNIVATGNVSAGNLTITGSLGASTFTGNLTGNVNGIIGGTTPANGTFTNVSVSSNVTVTGNVGGNNLSITNFANVSGNLKAANANLGNLVTANYVTINNDATITSNLISGNASLGNLVTANYISVNNDAGVIGNITGAKLTTTGTILGANVQANTLLIAPQVVVSTTLPGSLYNGSIAIDSANNRLVVVYGSAIHYINMTA